MAALRGHIEVVRELLAAGADKEHANNSGDTALISAVQQGWTGIVRELLAAGADKEHANNNGMTAWDVALTAEMKAMLRLPRAVARVLRLPRRAR